MVCWWMVAIAMLRITQRHLELVSDAGKMMSRFARKSKLTELSMQLMTVQLRETSLAAQLTELRQETLQLETAVSTLLLLLMLLLPYQLSNINVMFLPVTFVYCWITVCIADLCEPLAAYPFLFLSSFFHTFFYFFLCLALLSFP